MKDISRHECMQFVINELAAGNLIVMLIFDEIASKHINITAQTYYETADVILKNMDFYA